MEYKALSNIILRIDLDGAARRAFAATFTQIQTYTPSPAADIVIAYRGIEVGDVPQFSSRVFEPIYWATLVDSKHGYLSYIVRNHLRDHIVCVIEVMECSWHHIANRFEFLLDHEFMQLIGREHPHKMRHMLAHYLEFAKEDESKTSLHNACTIALAVDFRDFDMDGDLYVIERNLRRIIAAMSAAGMMIPDALRNFTQRYATDIEAVEMFCDDM